VGGQCGSDGTGEPWIIGIRHPAKKGGAIARLPLVTGGLASSGDYERCIEADGRRYGHILNPKTGWPVQGLASVSVMADQCLVAGSSATLALLMPDKEALSWLESLGVSWLAVDTELNIYGAASTS